MSRRRLLYQWPLRDTLLAKIRPLIIESIQEFRALVLKTDNFTRPRPLANRNRDKYPVEYIDFRGELLTRPTKPQDRGLTSRFSDVFVSVLIKLLGAKA